MKSQSLWPGSWWLLLAITLASASGLLIAQPEVEEKAKTGGRFITLTQVVNPSYSKLKKMFGDIEREVARLRQAGQNQKADEYE